MAKRRSTKRKTPGCLTLVIILFIFGVIGVLGNRGDSGSRGRTASMSPSLPRVTATARPSVTVTARPAVTATARPYATTAARPASTARATARPTGPVWPATTPPADTFTLTESLRPGDVSHAVFQLQSRLYDLGYTSVSRNGRYDDATVEAVRAFQSDQRLTADGIAGRMTVAALFAGSNVAVITPTATPSPTPRPTPTPRPASASYSSPSSGTTYVLNTNTGKFHRPSCSDVKKIKSYNRRDFTGTRSEVINMGYSPCGHCNP